MKQIDSSQKYNKVLHFYWEGDKHRPNMPFAPSYTLNREAGMYVSDHTTITNCPLDPNPGQILLGY